MFGDVFRDGFPFVLVGSDFFATAADGDNATEGGDLIAGPF
jgi:hypothetical protein